MTDQDVRQHSEYELLRLKRIQRNNEHLANLGLVSAKRALVTSSSTKARRKAIIKASTETPRTPQRRSKRVLKRSLPSAEATKADAANLLDDYEDGFSTPRKKKTALRVTKYRCDIPMDVKSSPLTAQQKTALSNKMKGDFLSIFEEYLTSIDPLSHGNRRNVVRQITKLCMGEGITYESKAYGWPEGCYFLKGVNVGPHDDVLNLMEVGRRCEDEWGKDHGNGWLLNHPLKKLYQFQQYYLENH